MAIDYSRSLTPITDKNDIKDYAAIILAYNDEGLADLLDIYKSVYVNYDSSEEKEDDSYYSTNNLWSYLQNVKISQPDLYIGFQGTQGLQGYRGTQGPIGLQGKKGNVGYGARGTQGIIGYQGYVGIQGPQGIQGIQGEVGDAVQGYQGYRGLQGAQGYRGATGVGGTQGYQGYQGISGNKGLQGTTGSVRFSWEDVSNLLSAHAISLSNGELTINTGRFSEGVYSPNGFYEIS